MTEPGITQIQAIIDGPWRHAALAREAAEQNCWPAFLQETSPRPSWINVTSRLAWSACFDLARELYSGPRPALIELVPIWIGDNPGEMDDDAWFTGHLMRVNGGEWGQVEYGPVSSDAPATLHTVIHATGQQWDVGNIVSSRSYAPSIPLALRRGTHAVLKGVIIAIRDFTTTTQPPLPRPTQTVPPFCSWLNPRVDGLSADVLSALHAQSVTTNEQGELIDRPEAPSTR